MTYHECTALLVPLALAMRAPMDEPSFAAYHRVLEHVPVPVFERAIQMAMTDPGRTFFPTAAELVEICEQARVELRGALPFRPCEACALTPGWETIVVNGAPYLTRCACWKAHQAHVQRLGAGDRPLGLPASRQLSRVGDA